ncbi:MAG: RHS repeat protein [Oligoflexia bacterium]|nr:RHS repeat protein [Oligoflexia bacterium]
MTRSLGLSRLVWIFFAFLLMLPPAFANVSLRNGNFFVGYTDIFYPGGFDPKIERVYNSKTVFKGMFGWGWGNEYEVYLKVSADGSVVVHEYGGGAENRFSPTAFKPEELAKAVETISQTAQKAGALGGPEQVSAYKKKLTTDASFRHQEWEKYRTSGKLPVRELPDGTQLVSNKFSFQKLVKVAGGYVRTFDNGKTEKFSSVGRLVRIMDKNNNYIDLSYTRDGKLEKLTDNFNRRMFFKFNQKGLLEAIEGENGKRSQYKYNERDELIASKDVDGNSYGYRYDTVGRHNMIEIAYADKTTMAMAYYDKSMKENIKSVKDRDGTVSEYKYEQDAADPGHFSVAVAVKGVDGKKISDSKYEYYLKRKADGEEWQYKMVTTVDGDRTETTYNECCGLPLLIKRGGEETAFEYDTKGHVTKKITPTEITTLAYDPKVGKVSKVMRYSKLDKKQVSWSQFQYDAKGNLVFAKNSENKGVKLFYDTNGRIKTMVDQSQRQISFKYNENSKPVEITDPKLGTITVSYSNSGEIKKVESSAGRKIALQVTSAFQNLLDIIRPAGVSLSF